MWLFSAPYVWFWPRCASKHPMIDNQHLSISAATFGKKFRKNSGKTPETLVERFLKFPSRLQLGCSKPCNSRHLKAPEHFQNSLPNTAGDASFFQKRFRRGPLRAGHAIPSSTEDISGLRDSKCQSTNLTGQMQTLLCAFSF